MIFCVAVRTLSLERMVASGLLVVVSVGI